MRLLLKTSNPWENLVKKALNQGCPTFGPLKVLMQSTAYSNFLYRPIISNRYRSVSQTEFRELA